MDALAEELPFLSTADRRLFSQVQGRTYAYLFGLCERFIAAKVSDLGRAHAFGDQVAFEAMVRMTDEELKHQELFRRVDQLLWALRMGSVAAEVERLWHGHAQRPLLSSFQPEALRGARASAALGLMMIVYHPPGWDIYGGWLFGLAFVFSLGLGAWMMWNIWRSGRG